MNNSILYNRAEIIEKALNNVGPGYYKIITSYSNSGIVRERVFCYEFYHQMRLVMGENPSLSLCGEIDKRGHYHFQPRDRKNPDFILHNAGTFEGNELVIEVKGEMKKEPIKKDFETLSTFIERYNYKIGFFILYNHSLCKFTEKFYIWYGDSLNSKFINSYDRIMVICKKDGYSQSEKRVLRDIIESRVNNNFIT